MIRGSRYVKPQRRTTAPLRLICATPEFPFRMRAVDSGEYWYRAQYVWYTDAKRTGTQWQGSDEPKRIHPDDFWEFVISQCKPKTRLYVIAPNAADFLTATGFWVRLDRGQFRLSSGSNNDAASDRVNSKHNGRWVGRYVTGGPPDIVHVKCNEGSVCCVSLRNYSEADWGKLYHAVCANDAPGRCLSTTPEDARDCPFAQCLITTRYARNLISEWVRRDCGGWRETTAQLSVSYWRRKFYTEKVCRHDNAEAIKLERSAAYGGRNEVWYYGDCGDASTIPDGSEVSPKPSEYPPIPGTVFRCDVSSQYPALLAEELFPVRLVGTTGEASVEDLRALTRYYGVIAHVRVRTETAELPAKRNDGVLYPTGEFNTTVVGPECCRAIDRGEIARVYASAYYQLGQPLASYAKHLLAERSEARGRNDYCAELFTKALSTAIGGKFSQRSTQREPSPGTVSPVGQWGPWSQIDPDGSQRHFVSIAGNVFEEVRKESGGKLLAAVYCFLTAYGRMQMTELREAICPDVPFAQCTDGIWVRGTTLSRLQLLGLSVDRKPGMMRLESEHSYARWFTPCHYYIDGRWVLSGYRAGARVETDLTVTEFRDVNPIRSVPFKAPMCLRRKHIKRKLARSSRDGTVGEDGWWIPKRLNERGL